MTLALYGLAKLNEECGELVQIIGKKFAWWDTDEPHWDGSNLDERLIEEMGDVRAAIDVAASLLGVHQEMVLRYIEKHGTLSEWEADPDNNQMGVDKAVHLAVRRMQRDDKIRQAATAVVRFRDERGTMLAGALNELAGALEETP